MFGWRRPPTQRHAAVYKFKRNYVVATQVQIRSGPITEVDWSALPVSANPSDLGRLTTDALNSFSEVVQSATSKTSYRKSVAQSCGIAESALVLSNALLVSVYLEDDILRLTPHRNGGSTSEDRGQHPLDDLETTIKRSSDQELGQAIMQCFEHSIVQKWWAVEHNHGLA